MVCEKEIRAKWPLAETVLILVLMEYGLRALVPVMDDNGRPLS